MRKRPVLPLLQALTITDAATEGKGVARYEDMVVFVENAIPGDVVDVQLYKQKKNFAEGYIVQLVAPSAMRQEPFCEHFGVCGGCKWQHLQYPHQAAAKAKQVTEALKRIGHLDLPEPEPVLAAPHDKWYRNKLEYTFGNKQWLERTQMDALEGAAPGPALGFHVPGRFDKIVDVRQCWLQPEPTNALRLSIRAYCLAHEYAFYDTVEQHGFMRNLIVRNTLAGDVMVIIVFAEHRPQAIEGLMAHVARAFPGLASLYYVVNTKRNDTLFDQEFVRYAGQAHLTEFLEDLQFRISPKSFFQTNTEQALGLYRQVREWAALTPTDTVFDLYTGTGSIALFVARQAKHVVGIEYVEDAIVDARLNAQLNGIENTTFYAGDLKNMLTEGLTARHGSPDVIITDPPRAGMHPDVVARIGELAPKRIVYVSCNPSTQARDLEMLAAHYHVARYRAVDMFPHTHHIESVVELTRRA